MALHRSESSPLSHQVRLERLSISLIFLISHSKFDVKINLDCRFKRERERQRDRCMKRRSIEDFIHRSSSPEGITNTVGAVPGIVGVSLTGYLLDSTHSWGMSLFAPSIFFYLTGTIVWLAFASSKPQSFSEGD